MSHNDCKRLFSRRPDAVFEHPPGLPTDVASMPIGPIEGFEAYGPNWDGNPAAVVGPFDPVICEQVDSRGARSLYIEDYYRAHEENRYWFRSYSDEGEGASRWCWYQSGCTLRFVRKPAEPTP